MIKILIIMLFMADFAFAGAKMTIHLEENQATKEVVFQCADLNECAERIQERMEEGGCDPRVKKVVLETLYIPGFDDA